MSDLKKVVPPSTMAAAAMIAGRRKARNYRGYRARLSEVIDGFAEEIEQTPVPDNHGAPEN